MRNQVNFQDPYASVEAGGIERKRALAALLQKQSLEQQPTEQIGGWAVRQKMGYGKIAQALAGGLMHGMANTDQDAMQQKNRSALAQTMQQAMQAGTGTPGAPSPADELGGGPAQPAAAPDRQEMARLLMGNPQTQQIGMQEFVRQMNPPTATPDAIMREAGLDRRHAAPSGGNLLSAQTAWQNHLTPSGGAVLADERARSEGALGRGNTMGIARMTDARAREAAQAGRIPPGYRATPDGGLEATPGGPADAKEAKKTGEIQKNIDMYVAARDGLMTGLEGSTTGPALGRIPAVTTGQQVAEGGVSAMAPVLKQLFRVAGEGVFTDRDQDLLIKMVPSRSDRPEARAEKMANIDRIVSAKLGMPVPERGAAVAPRVVDW